MSCRIVTAVVLTSIFAAAVADPVVECRERYAENAQKHIACLEAALNARGDSPVDKAKESGSESVSEPESGLGAEQVRNRQSTGDSRVNGQDMRILSASYNARGLGTFRMANGQVWRETMASPERRRLQPDQEYKARIVRGKIGGYRMHVEGVRWMMTVERIE